MAATEILERRRTLRYRHLLVRQMVQLKNRVSGLLMETGVSHNKQQLHKVGYFPELLANADAVSASTRQDLESPRQQPCHSIRPQACGGDPALLKKRQVVYQPTFGMWR
jgi:hypothetical protein